MLFPACAAADAAAIVMWDRLLERCSASPAFADLARVTARAVDMGHMMNQIINQDRGSFESVVAKIAKLNRLAGASSEGEYGGLSRKSFWSGIVTAQAARSVNRPFHEIAPTAFACLMQAAIDHDVAPEMIVTFELEANFWNFEPTDETAEISFIEALGKGVDGSSAAMFLAMRIKADMERQIGARAAQHDPPGLRRRRAV